MYSRIDELKQFVRSMRRENTFLLNIKIRVRDYKDRVYFTLKIF